MNDPYYRHHLFFCVNEREHENCCARHDSKRLREYAKDLVKKRGIDGPGGVRVNQSGCLDRCAEGPVAVVYPEGIWYSYVDETDIQEIVEEHLVHGRPVKRLMI
ncbi:MAG: (2Fe-2S) ferredoxin domain-containing protein [Acidiferrobacteraceae bacterium]